MEEVNEDGDTFKMTRLERASTYTCNQQSHLLLKTKSHGNVGIKLSNQNVKDWSLGSPLEREKTVGEESTRK